MTIADTHFNATKLLKEVLKQHKKLQVKVSQFLDTPELPQDLLTQKVTKEGCTGGTWLPNELLEYYQEWLKSVGTRSKSQMEECMLQEWQNAVYNKRTQ